MGEERNVPPHEPMSRFDSVVLVAAILFALGVCVLLVVLLL